MTSTSKDGSEAPTTFGKFGGLRSKVRVRARPAVDRFLTDAGVTFRVNNDNDASKLATSRYPLGMM